MSNSPAFQFYPGDWLRNSNLRRCSHAARGAWIDVLCLMHDSEQYGVLRWPLVDISQASGVPIDLLKELAVKGVLKGGDDGCEPFIYTPRHAGKDGQPVTLIEKATSACWYSSRFVRDEHVRLNRGKQTQFTPDNQPNRKPNKEPKATPKATIGTRQGDGASTASASASALAFALSSTSTGKADQDQKPSAAEASAKKTAARGERLSGDWSLPDDWRPDALDAGVPVGAVDLESSKFRDYWVAKTGKDATKHDWRATWRNWCRNAAGRTYKATPIKPSKHDLSTMNYDKGVDHEGRF